MAYQPQRDPTNVLGRRFGAFFIDFILGNAIAIAFLAAMKSASYTGAPENACSRLQDARGFSGTCIQMGSRVYTWDSGRYLLGIMLGLGVVFLNSVLLQGITGASVGKMITGTRVVNAQGNVAGIGRCFVRWLLLFVDLFCAGLVGLISVLATHPHRRVGDMVAGTYVIGLADVGQPVVVPVAPYGYAAAPAAVGWAPPPPAQPGWGAPPPAQPAQWGAPPPPPAPEPQHPGWGAPPTPAPQQSAWPPPPASQPEQPSWGAPPPSAPQAPAPQPPAPQPTEEQAGWAAPQSSPQQQPYVPPPPPPAPAPAPAPQQQPYVPPPPPPTPAPQQPAPPPWGAPPPNPAPPSWGAPPAPTPTPEPDPPAAAPPASPGGESWWDKGLADDNGGDETEG